MHTTNELHENPTATITLATGTEAERRRPTETPPTTNATGSRSALQVTVERRVRLGRPPKYHSKELAELLSKCWMERERMCSKRLVIQLAPWLEEHERSFGPVSEPLRSTFLSLSHATIDRVLKPIRDRWHQQAGATLAGKTLA